MSLHQTLKVYELFDSAYACGQTVVDLLKEFEGVTVAVKQISGPKGSTDFIQICIPGTEGKRHAGLSPTLGIVGRLGGIGARPTRIGLVSDGDGAIAAVATALKLATMQKNGDRLQGDILVTTQICPNAPTRPHAPVDFMDSPVNTEDMNEQEVCAEMDAVLSIDTTKGNRFLNHRGFAISNTVKAGYVLRLSDDLLRIMEMTTGALPVTFPVSTQDITPYGNGVYHINSILQPSIATSAPVVGVAISTVSAVPGCSTGASHEVDIAEVVRFAVEVAKEFTSGTCSFYDANEFALLQKLYGSLNHLQKRQPV